MLPNFYLSICLLVALLAVTARPSKTTRSNNNNIANGKTYQYRQARRAEIIHRATRTGPRKRAHSPFPGSKSYAYFLDVYAGGDSIPGTSTYTFTDVEQCGAACTAASECEFFRYYPQSGECALRYFISGVEVEAGTNTALRGTNCAAAKAQYPNLAGSTCTDEYY